MTSSSTGGGAAALAGDAIRPWTSTSLRDLPVDGLELLPETVQPAVALVADTVPLVVPEFADGVPHLRLGQLFFGLAALAVEVALGGLVLVQLVRDGGGVAPQSLDDAAQPDLVIRPDLVTHGRGRLVGGGVQLGQPLLELGPLLQKRFDAVVFHGHGEGFS